jgi:hypothetical protein
MRNAYNIFTGKPESKKNAEGLGVDGRIMLELILGKCAGKVWTGFI